MIAFADLHLREETEDVVFNEVLPGLVQAAITEQDNHIVCLGDFWHLRYRVSVHLQNRALAYFHEAAKRGLRFTLLPGNHDQVDVQGRNALEVFDELPHVEVHTEVTANDYGLWIPYRKDKAQVADALANCGNIDSPIVWMHQGVVGAWMNNARQDTTGLEMPSMPDRVIISGHYHKRQLVAGVYYVGSPYQTKADEAGQDKGHIVVDGRTGSIRVVNTQWGKRYYNMCEVDLNKVNLSQLRPGDEIRAVSPEGVDTAELVKSLERRGIRCVAPPKVAAKEQRLTVGTGAFVDYVEAYVQEFSGDLDPKKLMATYRVLVGEDA